MGPALDTFGQVGTEATAVPVAAAKREPKQLKVARSKYLTQNMALALIDVERRRIEAGEVVKLRTGRKRAVDDSRGMLPGYWQTYHCGSELRNEAGKLVTTHCRRRWCTVCSKIETARLIAKYKPLMDEWAETWLVTLTIKNVPAEGLRAAIARMKKVFNTIREQIKKQYQRGQRARPLEALRKLECTVNLRAWEFHPHFHLLTNDEEVARLLVSEWLRHFPDASPKAQDVRLADENSVLELFKYMAKLTAKAGEKGEDGGKEYIHAEALNIIFSAVAGERVFQAFNMKPAKDAVREEAEVLPLDIARGERWLWTRAVNDWVEHSTGELLTGYVPSEGLRELVEKRILRTRHHKAERKEAVGGP